MIPRLDEATTFAIQSSSNMNYKQMQELLRNLKVVLGNPIFAPDYCIKQTIGKYFVEPAETGTYYLKKERIDWSCKNADDILVLYLTRYLKEHPGRRIELVDVTVLIDHGKGFYWVPLVIIVRWKEDNEWNEKEESFSLASVRCRKDNMEVIVNTYRPRLNELMKRIQEAGCVSIFD